jgi:hypothetical protein
MPNHQFTTPRVVYIGRPHADDDRRNERLETRTATPAPATGRTSGAAASDALKPAKPSAPR